MYVKQLQDRDGSADVHLTPVAAVVQGNENQAFLRALDTWSEYKEIQYKKRMLLLDVYNNFSQETLVTALSR